MFSKSALNVPQKLYKGELGIDCMVLSEVVFSVEI